jgi:deoxyribose-phosphate aldolase
MPEPATVSLAEVSLRGWRSIANLIDHTLVLRPDATREQMQRLCDEARHFRFVNVSVPLTWVAFAVSALQGSKVKIGSVIGFPLGNTPTRVKRFEAELALRLGATELDMVMNIGALKSGEPQFVQSDIRGVAEVAHNAGALLKVILETTLLTDKEKTQACELAVTAGTDFVKTSTGLQGGATVEDVRLLRQTAGHRARIKASGGIRSAADLAAMLEAGADRIGTSSAVRIMQELGAPAFPL